MERKGEVEKNKHGTSKKRFLCAILIIILPTTLGPVYSSSSCCCNIVGWSLSSQVARVSATSRTTQSIDVWPWYDWPEVWRTDKDIQLVVLEPNLDLMIRFYKINLSPIALGVIWYASNLVFLVYLWPASNLHTTICIRCIHERQTET